jgi:cytosine/uracil/thiamine/allantoin permease
MTIKQITLIIKGLRVMEYRAMSKIMAIRAGLGQIRQGGEIMECPPAPGTYFMGLLPRIMKIKRSSCLAFVCALFAYPVAVKALLSVFRPLGGI